MSNFDDAILAAMQLDDVPPHKRFDDTKTEQQKARDGGKIKNDKKLTRPALPVDVVDPNASYEGTIDPMELVKRYLDTGNTLKRRQEDFELMMERDGTLNGVPMLGGRPSTKSGKA